MHVVCARTARESLVMSESGSIADLSQHAVMPYAEREVGFASPVVMYVCMHVAQGVDPLKTTSSVRC